MDQSDIEQRVTAAAEMHKRNFNCAQSVACACCDLVDLDEATAFRMTEGFGGGMATNTETCGALSGGVSVIAFAMSDGPHNPTTKKSTYAVVKQLVNDFREENGATYCAQLKGLPHGPALQSCANCISSGVRLTLAHLQEACLLKEQRAE